ncbi:bifunctional helix-turn-helix transcriptional regulator/GNAT family N-acetyltransferase [Herbaspirillum sp. RV1423]|uniref:bifunctional helix-turn-helix transcriptional regulator/GNAT family N-acetyltransferase n=1 Tax=Herbaspirillum sp. RV1423 TaxID=1443993 RepID=UPI0004AFB08A|nr:bifunctional helix-turn-helix transcriptional regulator/GNAT family N-acetyltransferase [Herbaspirillum sp. RV1423]
MSQTDHILVDRIRAASRRMVRELGFMQGTLAATEYPPSAVHAILEIGARKSMSAAQLAEFLGLEKSSVSRMVRKLLEAGELQEEASGQDARVKWLSLTPRGRRTLAAIQAFGRRQVVGALAQLNEAQQHAAAQGLAVYAQALEASRSGKAAAQINDAADAGDIRIVAGYQPGAIGRIVQMHAVFYARGVGFGSFFESKVAAGLAEFIPRLEHECNGLWLAMQGERIVASVAIDGEDLGDNRAHLRWFIVDDGLRGAGVGKRLLDAALGFCDARKFASVQLWTFQGLDAARRLYEAHGFRLKEEWPGDQWGREMVEQRFER